MGKYKEIHEIIDKALKDARDKKRFCHEHNFELERLSYDKVCEILDDINLEISMLK